MKHGPVTKLDKRKKTTSKKKKKIITMTSCPKSNVITIFSIYGQFGIIQKLDSRHIVCKTYIFINSNVLSYRDRKQNLKIPYYFSHSYHTIGLRKGTILSKKR